MNDRAHRIVTLAHHEYRSALRSKILVTLLVILMVVTAVSVYIAAVTYRGQLADYTAYKNAAQAGGLARIAPSPLAPLSLLRGALEYLEIIGAVIAIMLGYLSVSRERVGRALPLLRTRPVTSGELATGSTLGVIAVLATLVVASVTVGVVCAGLIGHDWITPLQAFKLLLASVAAVVYLVAFFCLGATATARSRASANGLMAALGIWLVVVLVLPQIGDTLDADNQIPGGLFKAVGLNHDGEVAVLKHFSVYERIRTWTEEASLAKHFERFAFAMTDVKERYRPFSLPRLLGQTRNDIGWMLVYAVILTAALRRSFRQQPTIANEGAS